MKYYQEFCDVYQISYSKLPVKEDFLDYFRKRKESGMSFSVMENIFSHFNEACNTLYDWNLGKWPEIYEYISAEYISGGAETHIKEHTDDNVKKDPLELAQGQDVFTKLVNNFKPVSKVQYLESESISNTEKNIERLGLDPLDIANIGEFRKMAKETKHKYTTTWLDFCYVCDISIDRQPVKEDFLEYFKAQKQLERSIATMNAKYSHLNKELSLCQSHRIIFIFTILFSQMPQISIQEIIISSNSMKL